jgi:hypothetical protein
MLLLWHLCYLFLRNQGLALGPEWAARAGIMTLLPDEVKSAEGSLQVRGAIFTSKWHSCCMRGIIQLFICIYFYFYLLNQLANN